LQLVYSLSFPTHLSHPRKCAPSLFNNPSADPLPFQGSSNMLRSIPASKISLPFLFSQFSFFHFFSPFYTYPHSTFPFSLLFSISSYHPCSYVIIPTDRLVIIYLTFLQHCSFTGSSLHLLSYVISNLHPKPRDLHYDRQTCCGYRAPK
jgi:hypothetical protein